MRPATEREVTVQPLVVSLSNIEPRARPSTGSGRAVYTAVGTVLPLIVPFALVTAAALSTACTRRVEPDAYGNVEATEVVVSAEAAGRLVSYTVAEGASLAPGAAVGTIDSTELALQRDQLAAQRDATASRVDEVRRQIETLDAQRASVAAQRDGAKAQRDALTAQQEIAKRAYDRATRLAAEQAATAQQVDQAERDYRVLGEQIKAQDEQIKAYERQIEAHGGQVRAARAQQNTLRDQVAAAEAQVNHAGERLRKTTIANPIGGTVLTTYAEAGEFVRMGQPLYRIADLTTVDVRAYITEPQLAGVRVGQEARVTFDAGGAARQTVTGSVSWISARAEFTPTPIQTREERADLVYAVKIRVPNDNGVLKIGMPVDVQFGASSGGQ
jgi:membrane fusion protein YbhG